MLTFIILAVIAGILLTVVSGVAALLLDPIICIFMLYAMYKIIKMAFGTSKKKKK